MPLVAPTPRRSELRRRRQLLGAPPLSKVTSIQVVMPPNYLEAALWAEILGLRTKKTRRSWLLLTGMSPNSLIYCMEMTYVAMYVRRVQQVGVLDIGHHQLL